MDRIERAIERVVERMLAVYARELTHEEEAYKVDQNELRAAFQEAVETDTLEGFAAQYGQDEVEKQFRLSLERVRARRNGHE